MQLARRLAAGSVDTCELTAAGLNTGGCQLGSGRAGDRFQCRRASVHPNGISNEKKPLNMGSPGGAKACTYILQRGRTNREKSVVLQRSNPQMNVMEGYDWQLPSLFSPATCSRSPPVVKAPAYPICGLRTAPTVAATQDRSASDYRDRAGGRLAPWRTANPSTWSRGDEITLRPTRLSSNFKSVATQMRRRSLAPSHRACCLLLITHGCQSVTTNP